MTNSMIRYGYFAALCMIAPQMAYAKLDNFLKRTSYEDIVQKEYPLKGRKSVCIKNLRGSITVKSEWANQTLLMTATKKSTSQAHLEQVAIDDSKSDATCITIETVSLEKNKKTPKASVDYVLVVPQNIRLELISENGNIVVKEVNGQIVARTCNSGNIDIENAQSSVYAQVEKIGSIVINQAQNNVKAFAHHGNITIHNAKKGIIAQSERGKLDIACLKLPPTSKVSLNTRSGNITLRIPESTSAELQAHTEKGTVTCAHYITVKPRTTQLNSTAWSQFKQEVEGTLRSGEATITMHTHNGNIKILDVTA